MPRCHVAAFFCWEAPPNLWLIMKRLPDTMPRPGRTDKMLHKTPARLFRLGLLFTLTAYVLTVNAQNTPAPDKEMDPAQATTGQSKTDAEQFSKSGGKPGDANDPNLKWAAALWQYREKHPGTPATVTATIEALRLLNRADRLSELQAKTDTLKPDDAAWRQVFYVLMSAASKSKDYSYLISKAEALAQTAVDKIG